MPDGYDPLDPSEEDVPAMGYLLAHGFEPEAAYEITRALILRHVMFAPSDIREAAEELGYSVPDVPFVES